MRILQFTPCVCKASFSKILCIWSFIVYVDRWSFPSWTPPNTINMSPSAPTPVHQLVNYNRNYPERLWKSWRILQIIFPVKRFCKAKQKGIVLQKSLTYPTASIRIKQGFFTWWLQKSFHDILKRLKKYLREDWGREVRKQLSRR